jgi:hypothetical protein
MLINEVEFRVVYGSSEDINARNTASKSEIPPPPSDVDNLDDVLTCLIVSLENQRKTLDITFTLVIPSLPETFPESEGCLLWFNSQTY